MKTLRTRAVLASAVLLTGSALIAPPATSDEPHRKHPHAPPPASAESAQVVLDWERTALATVYPATPIPTGIPILGFTAMAVDDAVRSSSKKYDSSEIAAVAVAAHDVLVHYFPATAPTLDAQLATSLAGVPDGAAEDRGARAGRRAAEHMIDSREGDGYGDLTIRYTLPPGIGTWQPVQPAIDMLGAWLGSLRPLVLHRLAKVDGPDKLTSADYTTDYNEVKLLGSATSTVRSQAQTDTSIFFNDNAVTLYTDALVRYAEGHPQAIADTSRLFAAVHASQTDSIIRCWQLKRDVGFWRPWEAVAGAVDDGNPDTAPEAGWVPLLPKPNYSDYVTGHGCITSPTMEVVRETLGETTQLELKSAFFPAAPRTYANLTALELDALNSRIWGGLHFRDAMSDGYAIGRETARKVMEEFD